MDEIREAMIESRVVWSDKKCGGTIGEMLAYESGHKAGWKAALAWQKAQPVDPWECAPKEPICFYIDKNERIELRLSVSIYITGLNIWEIREYGINEESEDSVQIAQGRSSEVSLSRDGEVRTYNPETKEFEDG